MNTKTGKLFQLALAGLFLVSAVVLVRVSRVEAISAIPVAGAEGAVETYRERIDATYWMLETGELTLDWK